MAAPLGRAERVNGGYRVSGRWPWASGSLLLGQELPTFAL